MGEGERNVSTRKGLPVSRPEDRPTPMHEVGRVDTGGFVGSFITRWKAKFQSRAVENIAERYRNEADAIKAYGDVADAFEQTSHKVNRLRHLSEQLALDDERLRGEREEGYEEIDHHRELSKRRRAREIAEADQARVEAERGKFTAEQGYENQQRLKDRNLRIWEKQHEAKELDAHVEAERVRSELSGGDKPSGMHSGLDGVRAKAEEGLIQALADGNDAEAERWQRVLDALGD